MQISEACAACKTTRKAIEYYERQGLIHPKTLENGYRDYSDADIALLKEITVLRKLDIALHDIREILLVSDRTAALRAYQAKRAMQQERLSEQNAVIARLISGELDIDSASGYIDRALDPNAVILDKLRHAFPGSYGDFIQVHFGRFLRTPITTTEQAAAYQRILQFLDSLQALPISDALTEYFATLAEIGSEGFARMDDAMAEMLDDCDNYMEKNKEALERMIAFRTSEEYKLSTAHQAQALLTSFNQSSGYYDVFLPSMEALSPAYAEHTRRLRAANERFLARFPAAGVIAPNP